MTTTKTAPRKWQGMNWISQVKRLAIYLRDGMACAYCGDSVETGARLSVDHVVPHSCGGTNDTHNLVTACERCNKSKNGRTLRKFSVALALYLNHGTTPEAIRAHVKACTRRDLQPFRAEAEKMIEARGSVAKVLAQHNQSTLQ
jgi:hypothetical protein